MQNFNTIRDIDTLKNKIITLRVDYNVPFANQTVLDDSRIQESFETIHFLLDKGVSQIRLLAHLGRPKGKIEKEYSLEPIAKHMSQILGESIGFCKSIKYTDHFYDTSEIQNNKIILFENLRFFKEEESGENNFAKKLTQLGDFYINDAFGGCHRPHASISTVANHTKVYAGLLLLKEIDIISTLLSGKKKIFCIIGGSKISTKLPLLNNLISKANTIVIGGGMANTFLYAQGKNIGRSLCEKNFEKQAQEILKNAKENNCHIILPSDIVTQNGIKSINDIEENESIFDIGPNTIMEIANNIEGHDTVVWNGPLGKFEEPPFDKGTNSIANIIAQKTTNNTIKSILGGGDTASAINKTGLSSQISHISTGGGAFLEWLEGKKLPGITILEK